MKSKPFLWIALLALVALSYTTFLGKSYENLLRGIDSNIHAKVSLNVTDRGLVPHLPMLGVNSKTLSDQNYFNDHPFVPFWANGLVMRLLGPSGWSARVLTASFSVGCVLLVFYLGSLLSSSLFGFISALLFLFTRDIILTGATFSLDPPMMFFILLSFIYWQKRSWLGVAIATGIGLWIKTPVVLLVYPTAFIVTALQGHLKNQLKAMIFSAVVALGIGSLVWVVTGLLGGWPLVADYWVRQVWGTAVEGRGHAHWSDPWLFFKFVKQGFIPGLPFLIIGIFETLRKKLWLKPSHLIPLVAIAVGSTTITLVRANMPYYYNPTFPFLVYLSAFPISELLKRFEHQVYLSFSAFVPIALAFLLCTPTVLGPEAFVALKKFIPFIQSYGSCTDKILLISGGEPIGSSLDYQLVLNFYADRAVAIEVCANASATIRSLQPQWIITSRDHLEQCIEPDLLKGLKNRIQVGNQYLLTSLIPDSSAFDLTVLDRELKPAFDCKPAAYSQDIYHHY